MDPDLAEAHVSLAWVTAWYDYDFLAAEREFAFTGVLADTIRPSNRLVSLSNWILPLWGDMLFLGGRIEANRCMSLPRTCCAA